jgi:uncharacterized glyoxalase superfamily protein PhnB
MKTKSSVVIFHVSDLPASAKFYREVLGFTDDFKHDHYLGLKIGEAPLHLTNMESSRGPVGTGTVYFFCDEVDSYYAQLKAKGAHLQSAPENQFYGMRDFIVADPDGNHLAFGCPSSTK